MSSHTSTYKLKHVKSLAKATPAACRVNPDAHADAWNHFKFDAHEILNVLKRLSGNDFYKTDYSKVKPGVMLDIYKTNYRNEFIYIHFYVVQENGADILVINSFHPV